MPLRRIGKKPLTTPRRHRTRYVLPLALGLVVLLVVSVVVQLQRPLPRIELRVTVPSSFRISGHVPSLPWPAQGEAVLDLQGVAGLGSSGGSAPMPLASVTKIMTALVVLTDHPLAPGAQGPTLTVTPADVVAYQSDLASDQSVVQVVAGEKLTEFQALQGLLLPSANNFADMLAAWDAGSVSSFVAQMNSEARALELGGTNYVDPSGINPGNVGTASDEVRLAESALENQTLATIVDESQATLPVAGVIHNVDSDLGQDGIIGMKTGSDSAAGGCFVFVARQDVGGLRAMLFGAVLGEQGPTPLSTALEVAQQLVAAAFSSLRVVSLLGKGQAVAHVVVPWAPSVPIVADEGVQVTGLPGMQVITQARFLRPRAGLIRGMRFGRLTVSIGAEENTVTLVTSGPVSGPSLRWRLTDL